MVCLSEVHEIVSHLRKQRFFTGNKHVSILIGRLGTVSDYVLNVQNELLDSQEWMLILQAVLDAQQNKDYIMLSDILEGDLLPYLQKIQMCLQNSGEVDLDEYWEENIACIKKLNPNLYGRIINDYKKMKTRSARVQYEPLLAINGQPILKARIDKREICMHSSLNPEREAKILAESWMESEKFKFCIFGMGMGYHVKALLDADRCNKVVVMETQIAPLSFALTYLDWSSYLEDGRLEIIYEPDLALLMKQLRQKREGRDGVFFIHYPSLQCIESCEVKEVLEDFFISISTMQEQEASLKSNFNYLQKLGLPSCDALQDTFENKTVVIVAGGPSVDEELENLKKFREKLVVFSVGTTARKLLSNGIRPDAIIITDPQDAMYRQVEGLEDDTIPLMLLCTGSKTVIDYYKGPIYLVYQHEYDAAEAVANKCGYQLFETGGSVTTTALDVSIRMGAKEVIFVGADMAYTDNRSHAGGIGREIKDVSDLRQVPSVNGGKVYTSRNLDIYRKWIERRIKDIDKPVIYNTGRGAKIVGTIESTLEQILGN